MWLKSAPWGTPEAKNYYCVVNYTAALKAQLFQTACFALLACFYGEERTLPA